MALGVSLLLTIGMRWGVERFMWAGFATASLLAEHRGSAEVHDKFLHRLLGMVEGSLLFAIVYAIVPESVVPFLPPLAVLF